MPKIRHLPNGLPLLSVTADATLTARDQVVSADASGASPLILSLPPVPPDRSIEITVVNTGTPGTVTLDGYLTETIAGALTYDLLAQWDSVSVVSVGGGWALGGGGGGGGEIYSDTVPNLGVTTFQGAVESLLVGAASTTFIFNSSGIQGGTRYNDWADLMTALAITRYGGPRNILFEQAETIPVGAYDLTDVTLIGNGKGVLGGGWIVTFQTGTTITSDVFRVGDGLTINWAGTGTLMNGYDTANALKIVYLSNRAAIFPSGGGEFIGIGSDNVGLFPGGCPGEAQIIALDGEANFIVGNEPGFGASGVLVNARTGTSGTRTAVIVDNGWLTTFTDGLFSTSTANPMSHSWYLNSPNLDSITSTFFPDPSAQTPVTGALLAPTLALSSNAYRVRYDATTAGDWAGVPAQTEDAIDRLAAAVADLRDGTVVPPVARPIP